jgi:hypothetical protein
MAFPPTQIAVVYVSTPPGTTSSVLLTIPPGVALGDYIQGIMRSGFFLTQNVAVNQPQSQTFIPANQIVSIVAS